MAQPPKGWGALPDKEFLRRCQDDAEFFFGTCCHIEDKSTKRLVRLVLTNEQQDFLDVLMNEWNSRKPVRIVAVKPRQIGFSTISDAIGYWMASLQRNVRGLIVAHEDKTAQDIFQMVDRFVANDTRHKRGLFPMFRKLSTDGVRFGNPDPRKRASNPGLDSSLSIRTAENRNAGHGWSGRFLHGTEVARWKYPEVLGGLLNALTDAPYTVGILESTGHGAVGVFHDTWCDAVEGRNEWTPIFVSWKGRPEYQTQMTEEELRTWEPTPQERDLMERHALSIEQMEWRRRMIDSPRCFDPDRSPLAVFQEQYPLEWEEAFQSYSKGFFDQHIVAEREAVAKDLEREKKREIGVLVVDKVGTRSVPSQVVFKLAERGYLTVWEPPVPGEDYVIGCDVSSALAAGDYTNGYVMRRTTRKFVARLRSKEIYPEVLGETTLPALGWWYNRAFIAPEGNSIGLVTARKCALVYPRVCFKIRLDKYGNLEPDTEHPGFWTERASRMDILQNLRNGIRAGDLFIPCPIFWSEARTFIVPEGADGRMKEDKPQAARKKKDDTIMSAAITYRVNDPWLGAGPIKITTPKKEAEDLDFRRKLLRESAEKLFKEIWKNQHSRMERDDDMGDF